MKACARPRTKTVPRLLFLALLAVLMAFMVTLPKVANAQAPARQMTQVPGYYRMMLGDLEVTALYDGQIALSASLLKGATADDIQSLLARMIVPTSKNGVQTAVNAFLVKTADALILVDAGAAQCFGPSLGQVGANIQAAGYEMAQVDSILLTHLHGDHACGITTADGEAAFPNATVYVAKDEAGFWLSKDIAAKSPEAAQPFFKAAQDSVAPYVAAGKLKEFVAGDTPVPGVVSVPLPGHTPGHGGYLFASGDQALLVWGDIVHSHAVQFRRPEVSIDFDIDPSQAIKTREQVFAQADTKKFWVAGAHLPFPGIGHVRAAKTGYAWIPVEYGPVATAQK